MNQALNIFHIDLLTKLRIICFSYYVTWRKAYRFLLEIACGGKIWKKKIQKKKSMFSVGKIKRPNF